MHVIRRARPRGRRRFGGLLAAIAGPRMPLGPGGRRTSALHVCGACGKDFVNAMRWEPLDDDHWYMLLRCGNCGRAHAAVVGNKSADRFDRALDAGCAVIARDLQQLQRHSMTVWANAAREALDRDLVDASDFAGADSRQRKTSGTRASSRVRLTQLGRASARSEPE
jgi:DNA-directed RNA polymerase subunit RPC12/RpoP